MRNGVEERRVVQYRSPTTPNTVSEGSFAIQDCTHCSKPLVNVGIHAGC